MTYAVRDMFRGRGRLRGTHGPADGFLEEVQRDVLSRHPDWHRALIAEEAKPIKRNSNKLFNQAGFGSKPASGRGRWKRRKVD